MAITKKAKRKIKAKGVGSTKTAKRKTKAKGVGSPDFKSKWRKLTVISKDGVKQVTDMLSNGSYTEDLKKAKATCKSKGLKFKFLSKTLYNTIGEKTGVGSTKTAKKKVKSPIQKQRERNAAKQLKRLGLSGSKYHRVSKPVGGVMNSRKQKQLVQLGSMKPAQRFMFPNGKASYTFKGFTKANAAKYESERGGTYESQNLKINVVLI